MLKTLLKQKFIKTVFWLWIDFSCWDVFYWSKNNIVQYVNYFTLQTKNIKITKFYQCFAKALWSLASLGIILFSRIVHNFVAGRPIQPSKVTTNFSMDFLKVHNLLNKNWGSKKKWIDVLMSNAYPRISATIFYLIWILRFFYFSS